MIEPPYLLFLGDAPDALAAKVAQGIRDWRPDAAIGQYRMPGCNADLGLPDMTIAEAAAAGARTLVVGVANRGGVISPAWISVLDRGARAPASTSPRACTTCCATSPSSSPRRWRTAASSTTSACRPTATRSPTASAAPAAAASPSAPTARSARCTPRSPWSARCTPAACDATFRATGQTGILITGDGVPLDAVVADFMAGSIESLTPAERPRPLGPDRGPGQPLPRLLLRRDAGADPRRPARRAGPLPRADPRRTCAACRDYPLPSLEALRDLALTMARIVNPEVRRHRRLDQHRRPRRARGARRTSPRSRPGSACPPSIPSARAPAGWWTRWHEARPSRPRPSRWRRAFTISRGSRTEAQVLTVTLDADGARGRGECVPYARYGETLASVARPDRGPAARLRPRRAAVAAARPAPRATPSTARSGISRPSARGRPVWQLAGLAEPGPEITAFTLSLDTPEAMRAEAARHARPAAPQDQARRRRATSPGSRRCAPGAPRARIIVDANEGWTPDGLRRARAGAGARSASSSSSSRCRPARTPRWPSMARPLPVCADESCHDRAEPRRARAAATTWSTSSSTRPAA